MEKYISWGDYFYYDESSPTCLRWKIDRWSGRYHNVLRVAAGTEAGSISSGGRGSIRKHYTVMFQDKNYKVHRIIWELHHGEVPSDKVTDHIDGNACNNKISNLRLVSQAVNLRNRRKTTKNTSGVVGVSFCSRQQKWVAFWNDLAGITRRKSFTLLKYGAEAFTQACEWREKMIEELNAVGAGYTDRHGT